MIQNTYVYTNSNLAKKHLNTVNNVVFKYDLPWDYFDSYNWTSVLLQFMSVNYEDTNIAKNIAH